MAVPKKHERLQTVLNLEKSIDIRKAFESLNGYRFIALADDTGYEIWFEDKCVAHCCHSEEFYRFLARHHKTWTGYVSQPPILADGWMVIAADTLFIIENQSKLSETTDAALQCCDFKQKQYAKLCDGLYWQVKYAYLLNKCYLDFIHYDTRNYVYNMGCHYFFDTIPEMVGLA